MHKMKLTIELVPKTAFFKNVRSEVTKDEWGIIRRKAYKNAGYICEICGGVGKQHPVECHEIWKYKNGIQKLLGFVALCPDCHQVKHLGLSQMRGLEEECIKHLMKVNNITKKEAKLYIAECWDIWSGRNEQDWKLDISLLEQMRGTWSEIL